MYENLKSFLVTWNDKNNDRQKLQQVYLLIVIIGVFVAGIVSLVNPELGHNLVLVALSALLVFFANAIIWNLLKGSLLVNLSSKKRNK